MVSSKLSAWKKYFSKREWEKKPRDAVYPLHLWKGDEVLVTAKITCEIDKDLTFETPSDMVATAFQHWLIKHGYEESDDA